jgi:hypothetical protein
MKLATFGGLAFRSTIGDVSFGQERDDPVAVRPEWVTRSHPTSFRLILVAANEK